MKPSIVICIVIAVVLRDFLESYESLVQSQSYISIGHLRLGFVRSTNVENLTHTHFLEKSALSVVILPTIDDSGINNQKMALVNVKQKLALCQLYIYFDVNPHPTKYIHKYSKYSPKVIQTNISKGNIAFASGNTGERVSHQFKRLQFAGSFDPLVPSTGSI